MGKVFKAKCRNCGFEATVREGPHEDKNYMFFGCTKCKKMITVDSRYTDKGTMHKLAIERLCPDCGGKIINYYSREYIQKSKGKKALLCPKCMTYNLKLKTTLILERVIIW